MNSWCTRISIPRSVISHELQSPVPVNINNKSRISIGSWAAPSQDGLHLKMHYIRLHRCITTISSASTPHLYYCQVVFTITTDLGDDFYAPLEPLPLSFLAENSRVGPVDDKPVYWKAGMRVLSVFLAIPMPDLFKRPAMLHIYATSQDTANPALPYWSHGLKEPQFELIIPCHVKMQENTLQEHSFRTLPLHSGDDLLFKEELGESIARHLWDAGVITASFISDMCKDKEAMSSVLPIASDQKHVRVLELGCGIGVLGVTVAGVIEQVAVSQGCENPSTVKVLLTDVPDAEESASSNITEVTSQHWGSWSVELGYENLDWDDGKQGKFGPLASQRWDYVILSDCTYNVDSFPALVGTLSAVHAQNCRLAQSEVKTHVLLATKPRHSSEEALLGVLEEEGWRHRVAKSFPILRDNAEDEVVYIYILEKGASPTPSPPPYLGWNSTPLPYAPAEEGETKKKTKKGANPTPAPAPSPPANKRKTRDRSTKATAGEKTGTSTSPTKKARS